MISPDELHELLHAHAATIDPVPHLAELGAGLTGVERHRRARAVVSTTIAAVAVAAAVTAVRAIETRPSRIDTAPATQRVVIAPGPQKGRIAWVSPASCCGDSRSTFMICQCRRVSLCPAKVRSAAVSMRRSRCLSQ